MTLKENMYEEGVKKMDLISTLAQQKAIVADGAMGTMLLESGVPMGQNLEALNIIEPGRVLDIHNAYIASGAELLETNSFGANPIRLSRYGLKNKVAEINKQAVALARQAAGEQALVAAAVGPLGRSLAPWGTLTEGEAKEAFGAQLEALLAGKPDLILCETFSDLEELKIALGVLKQMNNTIPVAVTMAFLPDGTTAMGVGAVEAAQALQELGVEYFGANCGSGPQEVISIVEKLSAIEGLKLIAQPNAGRPQLVEGRTVYFSTPEYFAQTSSTLLELGVAIVGGCCGTTPAHTRAMVRSKQTWLEEGSPRKAVKMAAEPRKRTVKLQPEARPGILEAIDRGFVKTVEIDPPKGVDLKQVLEGSRMLKLGGIDAINIADSPMARVRMSPVAIAHLLREQVGIESILHFTCRDRNLLGLQSELLGAAALGVKNVLALTGDPPTIGDHPQATAVFDVNSEGLVRIITGLNHGHDMMGNQIGSSTNFAIGVAVNPQATDLNKEIERLHGKIEAGAHFAQTQPIYDIALLEHFLKAIEGVKIPILVGVLPLRSTRHAEFLHNEVPGISIPEEIRLKMREGDAKDQARCGVEIARKFVYQLKDRVAGVYLMPPFGAYRTALEVLECV
jgi:methionine synthase I (cobalamin-dependent)/5,10-methylenetetrahydrofolate reductase